MLLLPQLRRNPMPGTGAPIAAARLGWAVGAAVALLAMRPLLDVPGAGPVLAVLAGGTAIAALRQLLPEGALRAARGLPSVIVARGLFSAGFAAADAYLPYSLIALPRPVAGGRRGHHDGGRGVVGDRLGAAEPALRPADRPAVHRRSARACSSRERSSSAPAPRRR